MTTFQAFRFALILAIAPALAGCGIPDLVAHGVKAVEKRNQGQAGESTSSAPQSSPQAQQQPDEPPPPARAPAPQRSTVTVEELPAR